MRKRIQLGITLVVTLLFCFVVGLNSSMGAINVTPTLRPDTTLPTTDSINVPANDQSTIIKPNIDSNIILNAIKPVPTFQYPQGGETIMMEQPILIEFDVKQLPEDFEVFENTGSSGDWKTVVPNPSNKKINSHDDHYTVSILWQFPLDAKAMPNNTAKFKVVAYWDDNKTISTESISKGFTVLDKTSGAASSISHSLWDLPINAEPGNKKVSLSWTPVAADQGKVNYSIMRDKLGDDELEISITDFPVNAPAYTDNTVKNNTTYRYDVVANVLDMKREFYQEVTVTPTAVLVFTVGSNIIKLNGVELQIDSPPVIVNGRTLVPIRALVENIGGAIDYDPATEEITIVYNNKTLIMQVGNTMATLNGVSVEMEVPPYVTDEGRTMIPLRFVSENLGLNVIWDNTTQSITINF